MPEPRGGRQEKGAARDILRAFATRAYRRPATEDEVNRLVRFVDLARRNGDNFETGIRTALEAIIPLSVTMRESIEAMRRWAARRARPANLTQL